MRLLLSLSTSFLTTTRLSRFPLLFLLSHSLYSSSPPLSRSPPLNRSCSFSSQASWPKMTTAMSSEPPFGLGGGGGAEVGISRRLWIKFRRESIFALYTPFVLCLAAGNLSIDTFRHYIAQNVHFLRAFAQAYELAEDCADDDDAKVAISELRRRIVEELKMHDSFAQEWDSNLVKDSLVNPATTKYTDFLSATALGKFDGEKGATKLATPFEKTRIDSYILGAVTPCMRLYAFIGKELQALLDPNNNSHLYKKWINNYSSESFQASASRTEDLLDKLSVSLTSEELDIIEKLYLQAMKLETEFFSAQPLAQSTVVPLSKELKSADSHLMLFTDFDLTCTVIDSSAILAEIAIVTAPKSAQNQLGQLSSADMKSSWGVLSKLYTAEYERCLENILTTQKDEKFNYEGLCKALELLSDFEKKANARVIDAGVLKGLNLEDVKKAGEQLILQDGCSHFLQKVVQNEDLDVNVHVLSYCWCADLIRSAFSSGGLHVLNVHANEFSYNESISTGNIVKKVESPLDKAQAFGNILQSSNNEKKKLTVYIGDSVGDLLCLLKADIGIVMGSSSSLRKVGDHFGVSFIPLFEGLIRKQKEIGEANPLNWKGLSGVLYTTSSWADIHAFILGA